VLQGSPAEQIARAAKTYSADVIVMATHARSELSRLVLGSVAEAVVAHSPVPVVLARAGATRLTRIRSILVPLDDSPGSKRALASATRLARQYGARIELVTVVHGLPGYVTQPVPGVDLDRFVAPTWEDVPASAERCGRRVQDQGAAHGHLSPIEIRSERSQPPVTVRNPADDAFCVRTEDRP
jgi:nucleotide-binding universal stress UspA family protein